jgi:uncharacterized protein (TIGR02118 family)
MSQDTPMRVDHVGIAVASIEGAEPVLEAFGAEKLLEEPLEEFTWAYYRLGNGSRLELIEPASGDTDGVDGDGGSDEAGGGSFLTDFLDRHGPGLHHVTLEVADLNRAIERIKAAGLRVVDRAEADDWREAFVSPVIRPAPSFGSWNIVRATPKNASPTPVCSSADGRSAATTSERGPLCGRPAAREAEGNGGKRMGRRRERDGPSSGRSGSGANRVFIFGPGDRIGMHKHVALLVQKGDMSHEEFVTHWQETHTPIAREIEGVMKYTTTLPVEPAESEFDGVAELYFEELDALHDALGSEGSRDYDPEKGRAREAREDVDNFLAIEERPRFIGEEVIEKDGTGGETTGLYKHSAFLVRKEGMSHEGFLDHWVNEHVPIASEIPGVVRYARVVPTDPTNSEFDGIAELYFEELEALRAALGGEGSRDYDPDDPQSKAAREDVDNFLAIEERPRFIGQEAIQKDETRG